MASEILYEPVESGFAWRGAALAKEESWIYRLSSSDLDELDAALQAVNRAGLDLLAIRQRDFPLGRLGGRLREILAEIRSGRGFVLLRGLDQPGYADDDLSKVYWGIGTHLGDPATQNDKHDLLGHVRDEGRRFGDINARGYHSNAHLDFHVDGCEIVGLLCLRPAKSGGLSSIVSAVSIYNEIVRRHPQHLPVLYRGFRYIKREEAFSDVPVTPHRLPVFGRAGGVVSCRITRTKIEAGYAAAGETLAAEEKAALDCLEALARSDELRLDMDFQVGDIQLLNNYTVLHARTGFEDWPEPERRRHLLRLWLTFREPWPLAEDFPRHLGYGEMKSEIAFLTDWRARQAAAAAR